MDALFRTLGIGLSNIAMQVITELTSFTTHGYSSVAIAIWIFISVIAWIAVEISLTRLGG